MTKFNLELRLKTFGSVLAKEIFLEDVTDRNKSVQDWENGVEYIFKKLPDYQITDSSLDVFVGCQGIAGGTVTCEVFINDEKVGQVVSQVVNKFYAHESFPVKSNLSI